MQEKEITLILLALSYIIVGTLIYIRRKEETLKMNLILFVFSPFTLVGIIAVIFVELLNRLLNEE